MLSPIPTFLSAILLSRATAAPSLSSKRVTQPDQVVCNISNFQPQYWGDLLNNDITDLRNARDLTLGHHAGGGYCYRVRCNGSFYGNVAIYICNDNPTDIIINQANIADLVQAILETEDCISTEHEGKQSHTLVQGQAFNHTGNWNVILGMGDGESC